jgi:hypothetical protein
MTPCFGQSYELGGGLGTAVYSGDIIRKIDPGQAGLQGTLFGKRNFDNVWSLRVGVSTAELMGNDALQPIDPVARDREWFFDSRVTEFSAVMEFNFLDFANQKSEFKFSPYAFFGMGYSFVKGIGETNSYSPEKNYKETALVIPFGGGVKYLLSDQLTFGMELGFRPTNSDFIDKLNRYTEPPAVITTAQKKILNFGNPNTKDWYYFLGVTVSYSLNKTRCYTY